MKLTIKERSPGKKREPKRIRRDGDIPAVMYSREMEPKPLVVKGDDFGSALRNIPKGRLSTTVFTLVDESGKEHQALVKGVQYHSTSYEIEHLDFEVLSPDVPVKVKVPIECTGVLDCVGVKLGGFLRLVVRSVQVLCKPGDIPASFEVDVTNLGLNKFFKVSDLNIPDTMTRLEKDTVAVVVAKR